MPATEVEKILLEAGVEGEGERLAVDDDRDGVVLADEALPPQRRELLVDLVPRLAQGHRVDDDLGGTMLP